jgi:hypothetical protein
VSVAMPNILIHRNSRRVGLTPPSRHSSHGAASRALHRLSVDRIWYYHYTHQSTPCLQPKQLMAVSVVPTRNPGHVVVRAGKHILLPADAERAAGSGQRAAGSGQQSIVLSLRAGLHAHDHREFNGWARPVSWAEGRRQGYTPPPNSPHIHPLSHLWERVRQRASRRLVCAYFCAALEKTRSCRPAAGPSPAPAGHPPPQVGEGKRKANAPLKGQRTPRSIGWADRSDAQHFARSPQPAARSPQPIVSSFCAGLRAP